MADFSVVVKDIGVQMNRAQLEAIARLGIENGGTLEVRAGGFGTLRLRDAGGNELLLRRDGGAEPFN